MTDLQTDAQFGRCSEHTEPGKEAQQRLLLQGIQEQDAADHDAVRDTIPVRLDDRDLWGDAGFGRECHPEDEQNRYYEFLTNNFEITAEEVAFLYKKRWGIELLFKKMKQNFHLHYFYGKNARGYPDGTLQLALFVTEMGGGHF